MRGKTHINESGLEECNAIFTDSYAGMMEPMQSNIRLCFHFHPKVWSQLLEPSIEMRTNNWNKELGVWELTLYLKSVKIEWEIMYFLKWIRPQ